jgi:predicted amidophosphoribosyltransferase
MALCAVSDPLYAALIGYKESTVSDARARCTAVLVAHAAQFLAAHRVCVEAALNGAPDVVVPVPSTHRPDGPPLAHAEGISRLVMASFGPATGLVNLLTRGSAPMGHMRPHPDGFSVPPHCRRRVGAARVLLLDDTYVSGARSQSAAAALRSSGARSVVVLPLARLVRPDRVPNHAAFLARAQADRRCTRCQVDAGTE